MSKTSDLTDKNNRYRPKKIIIMIKSRHQYTKRIIVDYCGGWEG